MCTRHRPLAGADSEDTTRTFVAAHFAPERCKCCGEALTPWALKGPEGRARTQQCACDHPWHTGCVR